MIKHLTAALLIGVFAPSAYALTIDFNSEPNGSVASPYEIGGMTFTASSPSSDPDLLNIATAIDPSPYLVWCRDCSMIMEVSDGSLFSLESADIANGAFVADMTMTGFIDGGGTITQTFSPFDLTLNSYTFSDKWSNLTRIQFTTTATVDSAGQAIDNIVVNVVPIPGAAWLLLSAFGVLAVRKRTSRFRYAHEKRKY